MKTTLSLSARFKKLTGIIALVTFSIIFVTYADFNGVKTRINAMIASESGDFGYILTNLIDASTGKIKPEFYDVSTPSGAVVAFNLATCPTGWTEYTPAYGRFIRGIDKSGTSIDPDGQRALGNIQTDDLKSHTHSITANANNGNAGTTAIYSSVGASSYTNTVNIQSTGGTETRPKNVALLYCEKN